MWVRNKKCCLIQSDHQIYRNSSFWVNYLKRKSVLNMLTCEAASCSGVKDKSYCYTHVSLFGVSTFGMACFERAEAGWRRFACLTVFFAWTAMCFWSRAFFVWHSSVISLLQAQSNKTFRNFHCTELKSLKFLIGASTHRIISRSLFAQVGRVFFILRYSLCSICWVYTFTI